MYNCTENGVQAQTMYVISNQGSMIFYIIQFAIIIDSILTQKYYFKY